ncbi:BGTF surface domain-containing protein [Halorubrum salsamenti]|uniref:BGTF surface domain-containing protein n=1 Tax=Halorubrum salsamenti TaxID=2583990 RepID=UPI0011A62B67|nr:BGTF surface domain-containing protein [Halorubrum salsamenti]
MTSRASPDDADRSGRTTTARVRSGRADSRTEPTGSRTKPGEGNVGEEAEMTLRTRLSDLGVVLVALAVLLSFLGAAATGPAAATLAGGDATAAGGDGIAPAIATDDETEPGGAARQEIRGSFSRPMYTGTAGDPVEIRHVVGASGNDSAYLLIGGNRLTDSGGTVGFVDVVKASGGSTTINTRLLGTNESDVDSCSASDVNCDLEFRNEAGDVIAEDLANLSGATGATGADGLARPLNPQRYRLAVTNGTFVVRDSGAVDPVKVAAESDLVLRKPAFNDSVEVFTTADSEVTTDGEGGTEPLGALRESGLDRTAVTKGDRVVLGFESTGIWGALSYFAQQRSAGSIEDKSQIDHRALADLLDAEEGVSLRVRQTNSNGNERTAELDLANADPDDVTLYLAEGETLERGDSDRAPSRFYLAIDTSDGGPFTADPEPGDEFSVEFALEGTEGERYAFRDGQGPPAAFEPESAADDRLSEQYPYHGSADGRVSAEASFSVRERYLRYDHATADGDLLVEADNETITGSTSILPVTELSATIVRDDDGEPSRTESELTIEDGNFSVDSGLTNVTPGTEASYRLYQGQSLQDSRRIIVVDDAGDPARLRLSNETTTNLTVTRGESLSNLSATVRNVGQLQTRERLSLDVDDGAVVEERHLTVEPGASKAETFGEIDAELEPGEYPYELAIDGHSVNGTLTVEADPSVTRVDEPGAGEEGSAATDGGNGGEGESDGDDEAGGDGSDGGGANEGPSKGGDDEVPGDAPATFLPFGIGTRETFGGTVLVGATYLLGHWV